MFIKKLDCGNSVLVYMSDSRRTESPIIHIDEDHYFVRSVQEVREYKDRATTKDDNHESVRKSFNRLKSLINANAKDNNSIRFLTLTYALNMQQNARLMKHLERFHSRLRLALGRVYEYIYVKEKQERGAWHIHMFLFFDGEAPYLPNDMVANCWKQGFVNVQAIKDDVNNVGNYLVAYLTTHKDGVKLERLKNYESGVKLYNCSRGIKRPQSEDIDLVGLCDLLNDGEFKIVSDRAYTGARQFSGGRRVFRNDRYLLLVRV
jgi:hypothetical protein